MRLSRAGNQRSAIGQSRDVSESKQPGIGSRERQAEHFRRRGQKPISRIAVRKRNLSRHQCDLVGKWRFAKGCRIVNHPVSDFPAELNPSLAVKNECFPCTDRRKPQVVFRIFQRLPEICFDFVRVVLNPEPDVRVQENPQSRRTSQSSGSLAGEIMSPRILTSPLIDPIQSLVAVGDGGTTSATGFPRRVTRTACLVFCTSSRIARHFALNSEMAISLMTTKWYHSQIK